MAFACLSLGLLALVQDPSLQYHWTSLGVPHICSQANSSLCVCLCRCSPPSDPVAALWLLSGHCPTLPTLPHPVGLLAKGPPISSELPCLGPPLTPIGQFCFVSPEPNTPLPRATWMPPCRRNAFLISAFPVRSPWI